MLESIVDSAYHALPAVQHVIDATVAYGGDLWERLAGVWEYVKSNPVYTTLGPVRHYIGGLLFRNLAAKGYEAVTGKKTDVLTNPLALALLANLPDMDIVGGIDHRGPTHSLTFAAGMGAAGAGYAAAKKKSIVPYLLIPAAVVASHVGVDLLIEGGTPLNPTWPVGEKVQVHNNYQPISYAFTALGVAYMWAQYHWTDKLKKAASWAKNLFRRKV